MNDYSIKQAAAVFACSYKTVQMWIAHGKIRAYRLGGNGAWRIPTQEIERVRGDWMWRREEQ
jgi:excisionase family DNA binding protein